MMHRTEASDYSGQDLHGQDFREMDLRNCRFVDCDLRGCNFERANLSHANFTGADMADTKMLSAVMDETIGAMRNGGPLISIVGLPYPIVIDGTYITFKCETIEHIGKESLDHMTLVCMDKSHAIRFHPLGIELLKWYRSK